MKQAIDQQQQPKYDLKESKSYQLISGFAKWMDRYYLDGVIGMIPIAGDLVASIIALPLIYVCLFKIKSIPLTLAVLFNLLVDILIGLIPFWIGNICDFFYKANLQNFKLITGFIEGDRKIIKEVNRKATGVSMLIVAVVCLIALMIWLTLKTAGMLGSLLSSIF